jgi:spore coat polysaccharide biosynthesis predicted glycosyltransferase SpsG/2-polyprenyl-3-methyl-5-hydroxy-6-metoxy-1,4-benzoquinol methylase
MSGGPILAVPACGTGRGGGHLVRCIALVQGLRALGREAWLFLPPQNSLENFFAKAGFNRAWLAAEADLKNRKWDCVVVDHFRTPEEEFFRWTELAPLIGIDEGGPCRENFDFLIDVLPGLPARAKPNIADVSLLPLSRIKEGGSLPPRPSPAARVLGYPPQRGLPPPQRPRKILISFGQEDAAGLALATAQTLAAKNTEGFFDITLLTGALNRRAGSAPEGVKCLETIPRLGEQLAEYSLVITHYGITAFEAVYAGTPVLLVSPGAYHEQLAKAAGFCSVGIGSRAAAKISRLLFKKKQPHYFFLQKLQNICAALASRHHLEHAPSQSLAELLNGFSPLVSRSCPVCGASAAGLPAIGRFPDRSYRRCPRCGIIMMNRVNPPPIEYAREYFFDNYKKQYGKTYIEDFPNLRVMGKRRLAIIQGLLPPSAETPSLLDIGCAYGPFLAAAKEAGFSPFGIDPADDAVRYVTQSLGIPALRGFFPHSALQPPYDCVTLWYVIEHFPDCVPALAEIRRLLKDSGVLAFATPSFAGVSGRSSLKRFLGQSPADHWTIWSPRACKKALALAGFQVKKITVSGHHSERFPLLGKFAKSKKSPLYGPLLAASKLFGLGDTFEVYAQLFPG